MGVLLITGPGGSGKSTLAAAVAERTGRLCVSEDERWVAHGWSGRRTPEQERTVQAEVVDAVVAAHRAGRGVVLELILYAVAPNPLTAYRAALDAAGIAHATVALAPSADELVRRMAQRGRPTDLADLEGRRRDAEWQLAVLAAGAAEPATTIDPTGIPVDALVTTCIGALAG